ncbi:MAG TPA: transcription-repair coupling factor [Candidatus Acidoferrales bacterium]|nr:transcription-repair coupling factor [Candidatus Acidoferrales bacterium]
MILSGVSESLSHVGRLKAIEETLDAIRRSGGEVYLAGLTDSAKALLIPLAFSQLGRPLIVLVESNERAEELLPPLRWFYRALTAKDGSRVLLLPASDVLPYEKRSPHPEISEDRAVALWRFASGEADILLVPIASALSRFRDRDFYRQLARTIERDQDIPLEDFLDFLASAGYQKEVTCEMPGQYAVRGGIIDVFSPEAAQPVRIELLGDTIESIRAFDPSTQRSTNPVQRITLMPLTEFPQRTETLERSRVSVPSDSESEALDGRDDPAPSGFYPGWEFRAFLNEQRKGTVFDLANEPVIVQEEPAMLAAAIEQYRSELATAFERSDDPLAESPERYVFDEEEWALAVQMAPRLNLDRLELESSGTMEDALPSVTAGNTAGSIAENLAFGESPAGSNVARAAGGTAPSRTLRTQPTTRYHGNVSAFMTEVRGRVTAGEHVLLSAASTGELERFADICREYELPYRLGELEDDATVTRLAEESSTGTGAGVSLVKAPLSEGVAFPDANIILYGNGDLFETLPAQQRPRVRAKSAAFFSDLSDLKAGDYVVHVDHGIGQFDGLRQVAVDGSSGEFMLLRYAEDAKLYVPLARLDLIQKYQSLGGAKPTLDRLGAGVWEARKTRVRKSLSDMADQLLALYAERRMAQGHAFPVDTNFQREFEDAFEFEETPDQQRAIDDVKRDLESPLPMDRLLCGDVGYGKTEVSMRAAFKALADSKQVAVLAPTTVLAFQHFETFKRRFAAFPVRIEMLSRFRTEKEQKKTLADLEAGKVDIVIGTHRILSRDVKFHDLGLLVVDEEQRFGVAHKERLKEMRKNVDVLTMSATPIPRTLHMSLVGLRDMSVIETPPKDRLAIQTTVASFTETLIQRVIEEELNRGGQVFFLHNRVESIASVATMIMRLVPKARVVVGHGQMRENELEKVMLKFVRGEADILVSTTIIENGLDIPRANTIVINRADRMGLSELYQLRGRVGRSNQRAYAYLLIPPGGNLTSIARQRLAALKEFSDLGAGFRIAALDLELRGAGNLLGREQHGHIEAVGFDMYCQMLERAVAERKGEAVVPERRATLNLGQEIRIPPEYIESENLRLRIYKRIAEVKSDGERSEVRKELEDRFGPPPPAVENLLDYAVLRGLAEKLLVATVDRRGDQVAIKFYDDTPLGPERVVKLIRKRRDMRLDPSGVLWLDWRRVSSTPKNDASQSGIIGAVRNVLLQLQS